MGIFELLFGRKTLFKRTTISQDLEELIQKDFTRVSELTKLGNPSSLRQALIISDKSLDNALRELYKGETMAERLKDARPRFDPDMYNKIWEAHKLRNAIVHESDFEPPYYVVEKAIFDLKRALLTF